MTCATLSVVQFNLEPVVANDTAAFAKNVGLPVSVAHTVNPVNGTGDAGTEGTLDAQYAGAMGTGNSLWVWNTKGGWVWEFCQEFLNASLSADRTKIGENHMRPDFPAVTIYRIRDPAKAP